MTRESCEWTVVLRAGGWVPDGFPETSEPKENAQYMWEKPLITRNDMGEPANVWFAYWVDFLLIWSLVMV